jgi:hypothetical protein
LIDRIRRSLKRRAIDALGLSPERLETAPLSESELASLQHFFSRPKFFIMGYPRSGTTLLARLIRLPAEVSCRWQGHFASGAGDLMDRMASPDLAEWLALHSNRWTDEAEPSLTGLIRLTADYTMERIAEQEGSHWVGDKTPTPRMDQAVERLHRLYPEAKLLAIVRDGRDAALSQRIQAFIDQPETLAPLELRLRARLEAEPDQFGAGGRSLFSPRWLERVAENWSLSVGRGHELAQELFPGRYHWLRYEDLLADPGKTMDRAWTFLGVPVEAEATSAIVAAMERNPAADWHQQAAPDLVQPLRRGTSGGWNTWFTHDDRKLFEAIATPQLAAWNYLD